MSRSVISPEFKYAVSNNIYWSKLHQLPPEMEGLAYPDHQTEAFRGSWRSQFKTANADANSKQIEREKLHVEIGCNAGHVVLEWAKQNANALYVGIDWKFKQVYRLAEKIQKNDLKNILAFRANAERLPFMFAAGEIDFLHMFFPDPWPKKAQMKNRTANAAWLKSVAPLLSTGGIFHLKTDHAEYFEFILSELETLKDTYEVLELTKNLHAGNPLARQLTIPTVTLFERLFIKDGLPIHSVKIRPLHSAT
jgi:tRNA (guanine-N7-)-methyltransferase